PRARSRNYGPADMPVVSLLRSLISEVPNRSTFMKLIPPLPNGEHILEYSIIRPLGQGGFGTTYLCKDRLLKRICVLKEYTPHHFAHRRSNAQVSPSSRNTASSYDSGKRNFLKEARRLAQFSHPNIARINRFFEENNTAYFVM